MMGIEPMISYLHHLDYNSLDYGENLMGKLCITFSPLVISPKNIHKIKNNPQK